MHNACCARLPRRPRSSHTDAFEEEAHGRLDALLHGLWRRRTQCPTPRGPSENQIEKHVCREFGVAYADLLLLDIVREYARNPLYGRNPAFLMRKALKLGKSLGLHRDDSAHRKSAGAPGHRNQVSGDLRQSSLGVGPLQIVLAAAKRSKKMLNQTPEHSRK